jgi:hypothetical protein
MLDVETVGQDLGVMKRDVKALKKARVLRAALAASIPMISFLIGYLVRMFIDPQSSDEQTTSIYPYSVAMAGSVPLLIGKAYRRPEGPLTFAGILVVSIVAFLLGMAMRGAAYIEDPEAPTRYGVFKR